MARLWRNIKKMVNIQATMTKLSVAEGGVEKASSTKALTISQPNESTLMKKLPREVRDMIYSSLLPPPGRIVLISDTRGGKLKMFSHDPKEKWHRYPEEDRVWTAIREICGRAYDETNELHSKPDNKNDAFWSRYIFFFTYNLWMDGKQDL